MSRTGASVRDQALVRVIWATLAVATVALVWRWTEPWDWLRRLDALRISGWIACVALLASLMVTPLHRVSRAAGARARAAGWAAYRRALGIVSAVAALTHAGVALATYLEDSWAAVLHRAYLRSGSIALVILCVLLLTSFSEVVATWRLKFWKELHRLTYVAALLVLHHLMLSPFAPRRVVLAIYGVVLVGFLIRLVWTILFKK